MYYDERYQYLIIDKKKSDYSMYFCLFKPYDQSNHRLNFYSDSSTKFGVIKIINIFYNFFIDRASLIHNHMFYNENSKIYLIPNYLMYSFLIKPYENNDYIFIHQNVAMEIYSPELLK